ncbi:MAG TPA: hypothetical protein PK957_04815 [Candidatus Dojkabacteria bacterium]|nr:hypothetical protein [Candidatus Dojkabacteria bacterium]
MEIKRLKRIINFTDVFCISFLAILTIFVIFPSVANKIVPQIVASTVVWGKEKGGLTLTPMTEDIKISGDNRILPTAWNRKNKMMTTGETAMDSRVLAIEMLLQQFNSPMLPYAEVFVREADKNGNDWRLLVSISGVESGFGRVIPKNTFNGWGWKGGPNGTFSQFDSWEHAITYITNRLAEGYGKNITPIKMESTYCPPCGATGMHVWAREVETYMYMLDYYKEEIDKS